MKKVFAKLVEVTPDLAAEMLEKNTMNRNISQVSVKRYAMAMKSGEWQQNGQTITIAEDGTVLDGQHRLWAVIEAGVTITFLIVFNVSKDAIATIDSGVARTFRHVLQIKGSKHASTAASLTKLAWIYEHYDAQMSDSSAKIVVRNPVLEEYYDENAALIEQAAAIADTGCHHFTKAHMAFCIYLFLRKNPGRAETFAGMLKTGQNLYTGHPIMTLRTKLIDNLMSKHKLTVRETAAFYIKAWNAFLKGKDVSVFRWNNTEMLPEVK